MLMARTKGSGWGAGTILYQKCSCCGKKKAYYKYLYGIGYTFACTSCRVTFNSPTLIKQTYK